MIRPRKLEVHNLQAGVSGTVAAPATPDSSEKSSSEEEQQEPEPKDVNLQLDSLRASMQARAKPPVVNPPYSGLPEEVKENSSKPLDAPVGRGQIRHAFLTLTSTCQRLLIYQDQHNSGRLPGNMVMVHGERCAIELKILMRRPGHSIRIYQNDLEILDGTHLKNLDKDIILRVLEEARALITEIAEFADQHWGKEAVLDREALHSDTPPKHPRSPTMSVGMSFLPSMTKIWHATSPCAKSTMKAIPSRRTLIDSLSTCTSCAVTICFHT